MKRVLLVGGGTAGHVEPALAVGNWLLGASSDIACEFIGTKSGIENELVPLAGLKLHHIQKAPLPRSFALSTFLWPIKFGVSIAQALRIVKSADLVIGFGGYVSAPCYVAARISGVPLIIHEANAIPGWANKLGAKFADEVLVAFKGSLKVGGNWATAKLVGMPIREEIFSISTMSKSDRSGIWDATYRELGLDRSKRTIFIFGGSLGAQTINEVIEQVLPELLKLDINIIHGVGKGNTLPKAVPGYVPLSYISNMAAMYIASDLVIARGGAVTCSELDVANSFALIIPLPIGNGEQVANAQDLVTKGAAEICLNSDFTPDWLLANISNLISKADRWKIKKNQVTTTPSVEIIGEIVLNNLDGSSK
ncbi:unannotated protein [freshwater metagenome]|uniref:Unannotated protein n=1 Tax=freshwater metagenome TaxID=449393 RepID=A0A6J6U911_9ZZZZ|nr:UDP-N-acetylglucosamine--N-acetylmuramyl-(pentapeptide) pyrophosphoryl-undecaprenol N-acetylglucosamine transferase [Actinomycetota bacterium]